MRKDAALDSSKEVQSILRYAERKLAPVPKADRETVLYEVYSQLGEWHGLPSEKGAEAAQGDGEENQQWAGRTEFQKKTMHS